MAKKITNPHLPSAMIPPILCQTWKTEFLPEPARRLQAQWRQRNPDFEYRFYDDAGCRAVMADCFPDFLGRFDALPLGVMKADVFRYAVIYRDGGVYADIDMECLKPIRPLLALGEGLLSIEAHLGRTRQAELGYAEPIQIANCILAARPRHRFFAEAVAQCFATEPDKRTPGPFGVEDVTGPKMLTRLFLRNRPADITLLPQIMLMAPLEYPDAWPMNRNMYARHRTFGSWKPDGSPPSLQRRLVERNRLPNPFPRLPVVLER